MKEDKCLSFEATIYNALLQQLLETNPALLAPAPQGPWPQLLPAWLGPSALPGLLASALSPAQPPERACPPPLWSRHPADQSLPARPPRSGQGVISTPSPQVGCLLLLKICRAPPLRVSEGLFPPSRSLHITYCLQAGLRRRPSHVAFTVPLICKPHAPLHSPFLPLASLPQQLTCCKRVHFTKCAY